MIDTSNNALIPIPITRDISTRINTPNSLPALSKEILQTVLAYTTPYEMGRILSTCKSLRFGINRNERLWELAAIILGILKSEDTKSWRNAVIRIEQMKKGISWDTSWELDYTMVSGLNYRIHDESYFIHISTCHGGVTWDRGNEKKVREIKIPENRPGSLLVFHDNTKSIFLRPFQNNRNPIKPQNIFVIEIFDSNDVIIHSFFIQGSNSVPEIFSKGKAFVTYSTTGEFSIYNLPNEKNILIEPVEKVTGMNFELYTTSFVILNHDSIYRYHQDIGAIREQLIPRNLGSNLKDIATFNENLIRLTDTHLICDRKNASNNMNWTEVWRVSATADKIMTLNYDFIGLFERITTEGGIKEKCSIYTINGQKITIVDLNPLFPAFLLPSSIQYFTDSKCKVKSFEPKWSPLLEEMDEQQINQEKLVKEGVADKTLEKPTTKKKFTLRNVVQIVATVAEIVVLVAALRVGLRTNQDENFEKTRISYLIRKIVQIVAFVGVTFFSGLIGSRIGGILVAIRDGNLNDIRPLFSRLTLWERTPPRI